MQTKILVILMSFVLPTVVMAQAKDLKCFLSTQSGEEIQLAKNEMKTPTGFAHLKGQSFQKTVTLTNGTTAEFTFTLRSKLGKTFDFRINSDNSLHITAALVDGDMFQYTNYGNGIAVQCTKDYYLSNVGQTRKTSHDAVMNSQLNF